MARPSRPVHVDGFAIAAHTVSNADFARFTEATGYLTTAEREGWSFVFGGFLPDDFPRRARWRRHRGGVWSGATWLHPEGPASDLDGRSDHPVVHVSWIDAAPTAVGPVAGCRPRSSGSTRRAAVSISAATPGATS